MEGKPPLQNGPLKNVSIDADGQIRYYWKAIGYDENTGEPLASTLETLDIAKLISFDAVSVGESN